MHSTLNIKNKFDQAFEERQAIVLAEVIEDAYSELVKTSDFNELKCIVAELAKSQKELAEAQKRTEASVEELVDAQKRTEEELRLLAREHRETRRQLGGVSDIVGYRLEDEAYKALPYLLKRDYGIIVEERLRRRFVTDKQGEKIEVNIIGEAKRDSKKIEIVGEGKSQLSKNNINEFIKKKLRRLEGVYEEIFPILITYMTSEPDVEEYTKKKGIALYYSYDF